MVRGAATCAVLVALLWTPASSASAQQAQSPLFTMASSASRAARTDTGGRRRPVRLNAAVASALRRTTPRVTVPLPDGRVATAVRRADASLDDAGVYWSGDLQGAARGTLRLVSRGGIVVAAIESDGEGYLLTPTPDGGYALDESALASLTCGGGRAPAAAQAAGGEAVTLGPTAIAAASGVPTVDVMLVFTPDAWAASGGDAGMRATADLAIAATNESLANSLVAAQVRLVDVRVLPYAESRSMSVDLDRITSPTDGYLDDVHALRDAAGADLVSLVVERNDEGLEGLGWLMQQPSLAFQSFAFSVVLRRAAANLTLAHELGHNLGLVHDPAHTEAAGAYPYAYGYQDPGYFRDLMSYACVGTTCPRIAHYSNPDATYGGRPTGRVDSEDAARALRLTVPVALGFRSASGPQLTSVSPATVSTLGGARVTLVGARLSTVTRVRIGGADATGLQVTSGGALSVIVPRRPQGAADVVAEDDAGQQAALPNGLTYVSSTSDLDGDAMEDDWERAMGLDASNASGADGPDGDPDGDGITNLRERLEHGHPLGFHRRYLAEGATGAFFATQVAIANPGASRAGAVVRFLAGDGTTRSTWLDVPARSRRTLTAADVASVASAEFSIVVESQAPLVVDRTMWWDAVRYGAHAETSVAAPATRWYMAEGATTSGFNLFYLLQNPGDAIAQVRVRYLLATGSPIDKRYQLAPHSRTNIWVNREIRPDGTGTLDGLEVSAVVDVEAGPAIVVERAMYRDLPGQAFGAGHESAGVTTPSTTWFLAEGATGPYFDLFVLIANPTADPADVTASYLLPDGSTIERSYAVPPASRFTIWVDREDARLADTAVSTTVRSTNDVPIVVERAMWWPGDSATWFEAHHAAGSAATAARWALAEGEVGGTPGIETYVLIANTSTSAVDARVTLLIEGGPAVVRTFRVLPRSRFNVDVRAAFPEASGRRFATLVESVDGTAGLVVERAMYWDAAGQHWAAGTAALGTPLNP